MERRKLARKRILMSGRIVFNNGYSTLNCQIRNASTEGLGLRIADTRGIPDHVRVMVDRDQSIVNGNVKWRTANALGVELVQGPW